MKRYFGLLAFAMLFSACDDGDLTFENIDFEDVSPRKCDNKLYKLNENEALIINIGDTETQYNTIFNEEPTGNNLPQIVDLTNTSIPIQVAYRLFNGSVSEASICSPIPPLNPTAIEDWTAIAGTMQITTTALREPNDMDDYEGGQTITNYRHNIVFNNIEFHKSNGTTQLYPVFNFGSFDKAITYELPRAFLQQLTKCESENTLYKIAGEHAMVLNIDPALINGTVQNVPQTADVNPTTNSFTYLIYEQGPLTSAHFCDPITPANPIQIWQGTGQIEVTTTTVAGDLQHTIVLKNVTLSRGNSEFLLATDYSFGTILIEN